MHTLSISGRQFNYQNIDNAMNFWPFSLEKFYGGGRIESLFGRVAQVVITL